MSWLTGWTRRKLKIVENLTVSDYQMKLIIHKSGSGPDTSTDIYLGGNCRDDFADLRFTGPDQTTLLSYWIESITGTTPNLVATVWIKIPTLIPTNNIYIYYDNPSATTTSNGTNTFIQYMGISTAFLAPAIALPSNYTYEGLVRPAGSNRLLFSGVADSLTWGPPNCTVIGVYDVGNYNFFVTIKSTVGSEHDVSPAESTTIYYRYKITKSPSIVNYYVDNVYITNLTTNIPIANMGLALSNYRGSPDQKFSFIRNYASPEPTFSALSTEELGITATLMTLNTNICAGSCQITAGVTWQNLGNSSVTFTPAILIDGTTIAYATSNITIEPNPATGSSTITTPTLAVGSHTICPSPN